MKYLVAKYKLPDHWYPSDLQQRAKIDAYLNWHHHTVRVGCAHTIFHKVNCLYSDDDMIQYAPYDHACSAYLECR